MNALSAHQASILETPGALLLRGNRPLASARAGGVECRRLDTGHLVFDGPLGRRILLTDPDGHPLHECAWQAHPDGTPRLASARVYLDWGHWVGLKPGGLARAMTLDLTTRPGWRTLTRRDLRMMAARAMGVALEEVEFFYADDDLIIESTGRATIRQRKDALYALEDGAFARARFMACLSAMRWARIDYLPVVELFQSLLPGTGSAVFELIRGLYDDQCLGAPRPLRYRGIPAYPSEAAFGLFRNFFTPSHAGTEPPFAVFMDAARSHEVTWLPTPHPPARYVAPRHRLCLTVAGGAARKATRTDDASGLPFVPPTPRGFAPGGKRLTARDGRLWLVDHRASRDIPLDPRWGITQRGGDGEGGRPGHSWEDCFPEGAPAVSPSEACRAVLLYPDDETMIGELASQPFVADFWNDLLDLDPALGARVRAASRVLIHGFDACIGVLPAVGPASATVVYAHAAYAQKQAQRLWNRYARGLDGARPDGSGPWTPPRFVRGEAGCRAAYRMAYDLVYAWLPFAAYDDAASLRASLERIGGSLRPRGLAWIAGPETLPALMPVPGLDVARCDRVSMLQPFRLHTSILPRAVLHPRLHAWILESR